MPHSRHMRNIQTEDRVAVSVYSTDQDTHGDVAGIQLQGTARLLSDDEVTEAHALYYGRVYQGAIYQESPEANKGDQARWKFVKITPAELFYFDTRFFGEERQAVPLEIYT